MGESFELKTERLLLRDFVEDDFTDVQSYAEDPEVVRYMSWGPNEPEETRAFLRRARGPIGADPRSDFELAITRLTDGRVLGGVGLHRDGTNAMLGYCLRRDAWGRGYATEAARALLQFGFASLGVHRVWAGCDPQNSASANVLHKLGMRQEGHLREESLVRGEWRDSLLFAVLAHEWRAGAGGTG